MPTCEICRADLGLKGKVQPGGGFLCEYCDNKVNGLRPSSFIPPKQDENQHEEAWVSKVPWALFACTVVALAFCVFLLFKRPNLSASAGLEGEEQRPKDLKGMAKELVDTQERNRNLSKKNEDLEEALEKVRSEIQSRIVPQGRQYLPEVCLRGIKGFSMTLSLSGDAEALALEHKFKLAAQLAFSKANLPLDTVALPMIYFQIQSKKIDGTGEPRYAVLFAYDVLEQVIPTERDLGKAGFAKDLLPPTIQGSSWRYAELLVTTENQFDSEISEIIRQQVAKLAEVIKSSKY